MLASAIFLLLLIVILSEAFLKASFFKYINMLITGVFGIVFAFNFHEMLANIMISNNIIPKWANTACFILLFSISFGILFAIAEALTKEAPKLPTFVIKITSLTCATLFTIIVTGVIIVAMSMAPIGKNWPYKRIKEDLAVSATTVDKVTNNAMPPTDSFVAGLFNMLSNGSLSSGKSFEYVNADFLNSNFLNRYCLEEEVETLCGPKGIVIDSKRLKVIRPAHSRLKDTKNEYVKPADGMKLVQLTFDFTKTSIEDGGVFGEGSKIVYSLSQLRLICNTDPEKTHGDIYAAYPLGLLDNNKKLERKFLTDPITIQKSDFEDKSTKTITAVFQIPEDKKPSAIRFRQNFIAKIPEAKKSDNDSANKDM